MFNFKKPLFIFSIIILSISIIAGFFIRQKILNDWEIAEFNFLLKQIENLELEILKDSKNLEKNIQLQAITKNKNEDIEKNIRELTEFISNYDEKITTLSSRHTSIKRAKGIVSISKKYNELQEKIEKNLEETKLSEWNKLLFTYYKTISSYISDRKNILREINKNSKNKEKAQEQIKNLEQEVEINKSFLIRLKELIEKLKQQLNEKIEELSILKNKKNN